MFISYGHDDGERILPVDNDCSKASGSGAAKACDCSRWQPQVAPFSLSRIQLLHQYLWRTKLIPEGQQLEKRTHR
jgi:hypothetical protein